MASGRAVDMGNCYWPFRHLRQFLHDTSIIDGRHDGGNVDRFFRLLWGALIGVYIFGDNMSLHT